MAFSSCQITVFRLLCISSGILLVHSAFEYKRTFRNLEIYLDNRLIIQHTENNPAVKVGYGRGTYEDDLGNFRVSEHLENVISLTRFEVSDDPDFSEDDNANLGQSPFHVRFSSENNPESITFEFVSVFDDNFIEVEEISNKSLNRLWLQFFAEEEEHLYGGGEQFSHFSLRGHSYPMWAREQGVGRNKSTLITYLADKIAGAGGDYHTTYWPQPTFVSDRLYYTHIDYDYYSVLNFTAKNYHELELWEDISKMKVHFGTAPSWSILLQKLTSFFGRQPLPPKWLYNGAVVGLQGGTDQVLSRYAYLKDQGVKISAIWIQDWSGKLMTSLGKRVYWNWEWDENMYPNLKQVMQDFKAEENVRFLSYINPHIINGSELFNYAHKHGYFIKSDKTGTSQLVDFGEMYCGSVDLTNPDAYAWYKGIIQDIRRLGFSGWMADFGGEYLPVDDAVFHDGRSSTEMHNAYSELWAKLNREAIEEMGEVNDTFIFMRSGFGKSPGYTLISWGGDQNVDFSYADGISSVIPAALSLGMSGMGLHHSDIGGYVSLICMVRTEELVLRWAEMSVFTPVFRSHEGNRPDRNWQVYTSNGTAKAFARLSQMFALLSSYHSYVAEENTKYGYPAQRPLFFHYPNDSKSYEIQDQYLYGPDLLVAPVLFEDQHMRKVYLPADNWVYLWNRTAISSDEDTNMMGSTIVIDGKVGNPPVFYRKASKWSNLFEKLATYALLEPTKLEGLSLELLYNDPLIFIYLFLRKLFWYLFFNV